MKGLKGYTYLGTTKIECYVVGEYLDANKGRGTLTRLIVLYKDGTFGDVRAAKFFTTSL